MVPGKEDSTFRDERDEDTALLLRARDGDATTFAQLYRKYWPLVLAYLMTLRDRVDAPDDIAQEVFLRLWARRRWYQGKAKFRTYLFAYVRKVCLEQRRRHARRRALAGGTVQGFLPAARPAEPPDVAVSRAETNESLRCALLRLTAEQREALRLFHLEGLSLQEAAARAGCSEECLESRLARGRDRLRRLLCASGRGGGDGRAPPMPPAEKLPKGKNPRRIPDSSVTNRQTCAVHPAGQEGTRAEEQRAVPNTDCASGRSVKWTGSWPKNDNEKLSKGVNDHD